MTRHPLPCRTLLILHLALGGCGEDDPPPSAAPPAVATIAAVRVNPPLAVLHAAPEVLPMEGDSVRLEVELWQNFMPGDDWGLEDTGGPGKVAAGTVALRPEVPGVSIMDAWMVWDDRAERMRLEAGRGDLDVRSSRRMGRLGTVRVVVRLRTASGDGHLLQRRGVIVSIDE